MADVTESTDRFVTAPPDRSGAVVTAVGYQTVREETVDHRGLPSPFLTFVVNLDEPLVLVDGERGLDAVVAGLSTEVEMIRMPRRQSGLQAAVHPLAARRLFGMPASELAKLSLDAEDVLGGVAPRLRERLAEVSSWNERFRIFGEEMRLPSYGGSCRPRTNVSSPRQELVEAWRLLTASRGRIRIDDLAARVLLSRRRLSTLFLAEFGITPKEAARTMRFTHAITKIGRAVRIGSPDLARIAAECGFADQSHLDREFRAFAGTSPSGWIAEEFPNIQAGGHRYVREWEA